MKISYLSIILIHLNPPCSSFTQAKRKQSSSSWWQEDASHYRSLYLSRYYINVLPGITFFWDPWSLFHGSDIFIPQNWVGWNIPDSDIYPSTTKVCFKNLSFSKPSMDSRDRSSPKSPFSENQYYYPVKLSKKKGLPAMMYKILNDAIQDCQHSILVRLLSFFLIRPKQKNFPSANLTSTMLGNSTVKEALSLWGSL